MTSKFPERIKKLRKEKKGVTAEQIANAAGIERTTLYKYEKGDGNVPLPVADKLAKFFGVSLSWLAGDNEIREPEAIYMQSIKPLGKTIPLPLLGKIPGGKSIEIYENIQRYIDTPEDQARNGEYFYLEVNGDSMIGSRIHDGDIVLVRRQSNIESGEIAVVRTNETDGTLKRVKRVDGNYVLYPDNPKYEPEVISQEGAEIIGKVVKVEFDPNKKRGGF